MIDVRGILYTDFMEYSLIEYDLDVELFLSLVWHDDLSSQSSHPFILSLPGRSLSDIIEEMIRVSGCNDSVGMFDAMGREINSIRFEAYVKRNARFSREKMRRQRIWVHGKFGESINQIKTPLKIGNGHHRCLAYAAKVILGELVYEPVSALIRVPGRPWQEVV